MSDDLNPQGDGAPSIPPPATPSFLVWPGKAHSQTWMLLWFGIMFIIGALLPWGGATDATYTLATPAGDIQQMTGANYEWAKRSHSINDVSHPDPGAVIAVEQPGMTFAQVLMLVCAIAMVVTLCVSIWNRRLILTPTLVTWFIGLACLYFWKVELGPVENAQGEQYQGFGYFFSSLGALFSDFGGLLGGEVPSEATRMFRGAGLGFFVTMLAELGVTLMIVLSFFGGSGKSKETNKRRR